MVKFCRFVESTSAASVSPQRRHYLSFTMDKRRPRLALLSVYILLMIEHSAFVHCAPSISPASTLSCLVREFNNYIALKPGCKPQRLTIDACWGRCQTSEVPYLQPPYTSSNHSMCQYDLVEEMSVDLADCDPGVNRTFVYTNARRCSCTKCSSKNTDCGYG